MCLDVWPTGGIGITGTKNSIVAGLKAKLRIRVEGLPSCVTRQADGPVVSYAEREVARCRR